MSVANILAPNPRFFRWLAQVTLVDTRGPFAIYVSQIKAKRKTPPRRKTNSVRLYALEAFLRSDLMLKFKPILPMRNVLGVDQKGTNC